MVDKIPEGFKKSEVGVIPEEWEVRKLKHLANMKSGVSITAKDIDESGEYPCYGGNGLRGYTSRFTHNGRYALIGRQGALCGNVQYVEGTFFASEHAVVVTPNPEINIEWLSCMLIDMNLNQYSESSAQPGLSVTKILELSIAVPSKRAEQTAIATALSDIDELINSLTKLINKKESIKQGAMQELFLGERRLNGFAEDWVEIRIGDLFEISAGGDLNVENYCDYRTDNFKYKVFSNAITEKGIYGYTSKYKYEENTITVTARGTIGNANYRDEKYDAIGRLLVLKPKIQVNCYFISEYINNRINFVVESTGVPQLTAPQISTYILKIPTYEEQTAIARILTDIDNEIEKLNQKLEKYKTIKQGMMQELLTGKRRLI